MLGRGEARFSYIYFSKNNIFKVLGKIFVAKLSATAGSLTFAHVFSDG